MNENPAVCHTTEENCIMQQCAAVNCVLGNIVWHYKPNFHFITTS